MKVFLTLPIHAFPYRLDKYRPKEDPKINDFTFEAQIYFDDAFEHVEESRHLNEYAKNLVQVIQEVYGYVYILTTITAFKTRIYLTILDFMNLVTAFFLTACHQHLQEC